MLSEPLLDVVLLPLLLAVLVDALVGDPQEGTRAEHWYPPVLVGRLALSLDRRIRRGSPRRERWAGALLWVGTVGVPTLLAVLTVLVAGPAARRLLDALSSGLELHISVETALLGGAFLVVASLWLKSCFTLSGLLEFCVRPLGLQGEAKRRAVAAVVNRPTEDLPDELLNSALIESAAENTTDSLVAPLLAYSLLGLPGAVAYRAVNTLDALLGHRDRHRLYVGQVTAVVDHVVNWIPDRITAALLRLVSGRGESQPEIQAAPGIVVPPSIVAAARVAQVRIEKRGWYVVGPSRRVPTDADVRRFLRTVSYAGGAAVVLSGILIGGLVLAGWWYGL